MGEVMEGEGQRECDEGVVSRGKRLPRRYLFLGFQIDEIKIKKRAAVAALVSRPERSKS